MVQEPLVIIEDTTAARTFYLKKNNKAWVLTDLTITASMRLKGASANKFSNRSCDITDATNGEISMTPEAADFDTAGDYEIQFKLVDGSSLVDRTKRAPLTVEDAL